MAAAIRLPAAMTSLVIVRNEPRIFRRGRAATIVAFRSKRLFFKTYFSNAAQFQPSPSVAPLGSTTIPSQITA